MSTPTVHDYLHEYETAIINSLADGDVVAVTKRLKKSILVSPFFVHP